MRSVVGREEGERGKDGKLDDGVVGRCDQLQGASGQQRATPMSENQLDNCLTNEGERQRSKCTIAGKLESGQLNQCRHGTGESGRRESNRVNESHLEGDVRLGVRAVVRGLYVGAGARTRTG